MIPGYLSPLANHLWQSTIVAGVAALLALVLRNNSARLRYWLWFLAAMKFLIPFSILVGIGHQFEWRTPPAVTRGPISTATQVGMPFVATPDAAVPSPVSPGTKPMPVVLFSIWLCGAAVSVSLWIRAWLRVRSVLNAASVVPAGLPVNDISVRVVSSPLLFEPAVVGILKPVLVLPAGIENRITPDQFKAILIHELCHIRRRDNLATAMYMMVETLYWFYPLVRWIGKQLIEQRERACDEEVLRLGSERLTYAEGILNVCKSYLESPLPCASGVTGSGLKKRIRAILTGHVANLSLTKKGILTLVGMWTLAMPLIIGMVSASRALQAKPDVTGTWQGTLPAGVRQLRIVMKISKDSGGLKALMYSVDQGPASIPSSSVNVQDLNIKMSFPGVGGTYQGKLSTDGNSLSGTWTQAQTVPFNLARATADNAWAIPEQPTAPKPMPADANPAFEVATIRLSRPDDQRPPMIQIQNRRLLTINKSVMNLITYAYSTNPSEVLNAPDWLDTKYDIVGQPDGEGQPNERQWKIMLQKLLTDRFKLSFHRDKKEVSIYALTVTRSGAKLAQSTGDLNGPPNLSIRARGRFNARNATMLDFAGELQAWLDRPVVDQTGIPGRFDFALNWTPDDFQAARLSGFAAPQQLNGEVPDLFTAIQEQLGLRLESSRGSVEVMVIDRLEKPSEN